MRDRPRLSRLSDQFFGSSEAPTDEEELQGPTFAPTWWWVAMTIHSLIVQRRFLLGGVGLALGLVGVPWTWLAAVAAVLATAVLGSGALGKRYRPQESASGWISFGDDGRSSGVREPLGPAPPAGSAAVGIEEPPPAGA